MADARRRRCLTFAPATGRRCPTLGPSACAVGTTRRYRLATPAIRTLVALLILREKIIKPVLAGAGKPKPGRPPKRVHPLDVHYENLQREMRHTLETLGLAA